MTGPHKNEILIRTLLTEQTLQVLQWQALRLSLEFNRHGSIDMDDFKSKINENTAGLMLTET